MELETIATRSPQTQTTSRPALVEGPPLRIDPTAPGTLTDALKATARLYPERGIRILSSREQGRLLRYPELLRRAERILSGLRQAGLRPGSKALLQIDTLEDYFPAFWGCLLGGIIPTTVAIAPTYNERNGVVDKLANAWRLLDFPPVIATKQLQPAIDGLQRVAGMDRLRTLCIEQLLAAELTGDEHRPQPHDVAFIQLSSGSTGIPKCIQQTHRNIIAHIHSSAQFNGYSPDDVTFNWLPMDHVVPILTFHLKDTYLGCHQIHTPSQLVLADPLLWLDSLETFRATHSWSPNFGFKLVTDRLARATGRSWDLSAIRFLMNAGEQVTMPVVRDFLRALAPSGLREDAMQPAFGMAEVCTCMTYANGFAIRSGARRFAKASLNRELEPAEGPESETVEFVSLGTVTPGISIRIADSEDRTLPENRIGRLQIKGPVVTPGYFRNDEANREAFVGDDWFNTGDLGFIASGELYLTGREKEMIVVRGAKYYCHEVEDVLNGIAGVEATFAATCGTNDPRTGTETLAVFFVPSQAGSELAATQSIRKEVTARLGISPGVVVPLTRPQFPKTTSGKIQRTQLKKQLEAGAFDSILKALEESASTESSKHEANSAEAEISRIWEEVLERKHVSSNAHIFELGGDSLKATQIASRVRERWQTDLPLQLLFGDAGTVAGMARWISGRRPGADVPPPIHTTPRSAVLPLSYSQLRLWLADQIEPGTSLYNIGRAFAIRGALHFTALEAALQGVVERHEILRTVYAFDSIPSQSILPPEPVPLPRHDLSHLPAGERSRVVSNLLAMEIARPFDLETGPLLRAKLIRLGEDEHLLLIACHQIVTDAWSLGLLARELADIYSRAIAGNAESPDAPPVQYADYATWQQRWLADAALEKQLDFWKTRVNPPPPAILLRPETQQTQSAESTVREHLIQGELLARLRAFNAGHGVTDYMSLLTVFKVILARQSGLRDIAVGSPESGRRRVETESLLGCFVNMLMIRTQIQPDDTFATLLARVRQTTIEAFANADVPFEKVQALATSESTGRARLFNIWFGPIDAMQSFSMDTTRVKPQPVFPPVAQFDLSCFVSENSQRIALFFEHKRELFTEAQMTAFIAGFDELLKQLLANPETRLNAVLSKAAAPGHAAKAGQQLLDV